MACIRVMILAPSLALRLGLREMLRGFEEIAVAGDVSSPDELSLTPGDADVLLIAPASPEWLTLPPAFRQIEAFAALLVMENNLEAARRLLKRAAEQGKAWGLLREDASREELRAGLQALHAGLTVLPPGVARPALFSWGGEAEGPLPLEPAEETLTGREGEILELLAQGLANKQIAARLHISEHTVKFHISSVYAKLGAASRIEALRIGAQRGLIVV